MNTTIKLAAVALTTIAITSTSPAQAFIPTEAQKTYCLINGDGLNIRETPDLNGALIGALEPNDKVVLHQIITGKDSRKWAYVDVVDEANMVDPPTSGWASYKYLTCQSNQQGQAHRPEPVPALAHAAAAYDVVVLKTSDGFLALRDGPGAQYAMLSKLHQGQTLVADRNYKGWTHIRETRNGMSGWVFSKYVQFIDDNAGCTAC